MNDLTPEQRDQLRTKIDSAARRVSSQWPDTVEREDLAQDILVALLESPGTLSRIFEEDDRTQGSFLIKLGHRAASIQQDSYDRFSGNYLYDVAEVRGLLDRGAISETEPKRFRAEILDLQEALGNLAGGKHYAEIVNRYVHEIVPPGGSAGMKRIARAVEALTAAMNRIGSERRKNRIEGPGSRKAISNSTAIVITRQHTNGDYASGSNGARNL